MNSSTGTFSIEAISSIKAPVPPAQLPHTHIRYIQRLCGRVTAEENHLCILTARSMADSHIVIFFLEGDGIGNNLLNIAAAKGFSQMLGTGACQGQTVRVFGNLSSKNARASCTLWAWAALWRL